MLQILEVFIKMYFICDLCYFNILFIEANINYNVFTEYAFLYFFKYYSTLKILM